MTGATSTSLSFKQAGHLRKIPGTKHVFKSRLGSPTKQAATQLIHKGLVECHHRGPGSAFYGRTPEGEAALQKFDENVSEQYAETLTALWEGAPLPANDPDVRRLIEAGLANMSAPESGNERVVLSEDGKSLAENAQTALSYTWS